MSEKDFLAAGVDILYAEGRCLDERRWDDWLALYTEDCIYWAPASKSTTSLDYTTDPRREVSLIFYDERQGLRDRVARLSSGEAFANEPMFRTAHAVNNVQLDESDAASMRIYATWRCDFYRGRESGYYFGNYHVGLVRDGAAWKIANKTIYVLNDYIPTGLEFFQI